jgi:thiamine-monophosphate kinase
MKIEELGERGLINWLKQKVRIRDKDVLIGIGDDAAIVRVKEDQLTILTTDMLVEGIHFRCDWQTPYQLGYKSLVVNISDVLAMGGWPRFALISIGLRSATEVSFVEEFYAGVQDCGQKYGVEVVGGDISRSDLYIVSISLVGQVKPVRLKSRSAAEIGEGIYVTGSLGASAAGLLILKQGISQEKVKAAPELIKRHLQPEARLKEAKIISAEDIGALEDVSDGLASEILNICDSSKTGALIYEENIPLAQGVKEIAEIVEQNPVDLALFGGEDYELVFTARARVAKRVAEKLADLKVGVAKVGEIVKAEAGVKLSKLEGKIVNLKAGYTHF